MAVQVFVGTLTRFFARAWETSAQTEGRRTGQPVQLITPDGKPVLPEDPATYEAPMIAWRDYVAAGAKPAGVRIDWPEGMAPPYFTDGMGWHSLGSLYLWASYAGRPEDVRAMDSDGWASDPVYLSCLTNEPNSLIARLSHEYFLPADQSLSLRCQSAFEDMMTSVATIPHLRETLVALNAWTWKASEAEISSWRETYYEDASGTVESGAKYAFGIFWTLCEIAQREGLPLRLRF